MTNYWAPPRLLLSGCHSLGLALSLFRRAEFEVTGAFGRDGSQSHGLPCFLSAPAFSFLWDSPTPLERRSLGCIFWLMLLIFLPGEAWDMAWSKSGHWPLSWTLYPRIREALPFWVSFQGTTAPCPGAKFKCSCFFPGYHCTWKPLSALRHACLVLED